MQIAEEKKKLQFISYQALLFLKKLKSTGALSVVALRDGSSLSSGVCCTEMITFPTNRRHHVSQVGTTAPGSSQGGAGFAAKGGIKTPKNKKLPSTELD